MYECKSIQFPRLMGHYSNWLGVRVGEEVEGGRMETTSFFRAFQRVLRNQKTFNHFKYKPQVWKPLARGESVRSREEQDARARPHQPYHRVELLVQALGWTP